MLNLLGVIFIGLVSSSLLVFLDVKFPGDFMLRFMEGDFLQLFGIIVGLNITATIFLLGQIYTIENSLKKKVFSEVRAEIKDNVNFLLIVFIISLVILILRPDFNPMASTVSENVIFYISNISLLTLFTTGLYAMFEIFQAAFKLSQNFTQKDE